MPIESEDQIVDLFVQKMESEGDIDFAIIGTFLTIFELYTIMNSKNLV